MIGPRDAQIISEIEMSSGAHRIRASPTTTTSKKRLAKRV
jgi:hypothetical protein